MSTATWPGSTSTFKAIVLPDVEVVEDLPAEVLPAIALRLSALQAAVAVRMVNAAMQSKARGKLEPPYTLQEAARLVLKSPAWLRRQAKAGMVACAKKVGRSWVFPRIEFDRFRERRQVG